MSLWFRKITLSPIHVFFNVQHPTHAPSVDRLLNPCQCKSIWECECRPTSSSSDKTRLETPVEVTTSVGSNSVSYAPPSAAPPRSTVQKSCCEPKNASSAVNNREYNGPVKGPALPPLLLTPSECSLPPTIPHPSRLQPPSPPSNQSCCWRAQGVVAASNAHVRNVSNTA